MPRRSRAELPRGGRDGCAETGLPWKSSLSSACAVTAPTVRGWGRWGGGWGCFTCRAGGVSPAVGVPAAVLAGWRRHRARQPEVGRVFVPGSIEPPWLGHVWPRARWARGAGARAGGGEGEPCSRGLCAGVAMGRGPRLLAAGCEQLGAATPISAGLERLLLPCSLPSCAACPQDHADGDGDGGGPRSVPDQPLLGTQRAPKCFASTCSDGSGRLHPPCVRAGRTP